MKDRRRLEFWRVGPVFGVCQCRLGIGSKYLLEPPGAGGREVKTPARLPGLCPELAERHRIRNRRDLLIFPSLAIIAATDLYSITDFESCLVVSEGSLSAPAEGQQRSYVKTRHRDLLKDASTLRGRSALGILKTV
jgi:hypothetical protein